MFVDVVNPRTHESGQGELRQPNESSHYISPAMAIKIITNPHNGK